MLSNRQISFLREISQKGSVPVNDALCTAESYGLDEDDADAMVRERYLELQYDDACNTYLAVTDSGLFEIEEYDRKQREEKRGDDALNVARKANDIACESNDIARKANCKSTVAIVVAVIAIVVQIISDFGPELWALVQRLFQGLNNP